MVDLECLTTKEFINKPFNDIVLGPLFEDISNVLVIGFSDGRTLVYDPINDKVLKTLETKGGSIMKLVLDDLFKFKSNDLILGDSEGNLTIFSKNKIILEYKVNEPITSLAVDYDLYHNITIMVGDHLGFLTGYAISQGNYQKYKVNVPVPVDWTHHSSHQPICALLSVIMPDKYGVMSHYLLVSNGTHRLYFYFDSVLVYYIDFPSNISSMISGQFTKDSKQIAVACSDGIIYILEDYEYKPLLSLELRINKITPYPAGRRDLILCIGHFNEMIIIRGEKVLGSYKTKDWIHSMCVGDVNNDGNKEVVLGMKNQTIQIIKIRDIWKDDEDRL